MSSNIFFLRLVFIDPYSAIFNCLLNKKMLINLSRLSLFPEGSFPSVFPHKQGMQIESDISDSSYEIQRKLYLI